MNKESQELNTNKVEENKQTENIESPKAKFDEMRQKAEDEAQKTHLENSRAEDEKYLQQMRERKRELYQLMKSNEQAVADLQDPSKKLDKHGLAVDPAGKKLEEFRGALAKNKEDWEDITRELDQAETAFSRGNKVIRRE